MRPNQLADLHQPSEHPLTLLSPATGDSSGTLRCLGHPLAGDFPASPVKRWLGHDELTATLGNDDVVIALDGARIASSVRDAVLEGRGGLLVVPSAFSSFPISSALSP